MDLTICAIPRTFVCMYVRSANGCDMHVCKNVPWNAETGVWSHWFPNGTAYGECLPQGQDSRWQASYRLQALGQDSQD